MTRERKYVWIVLDPGDHGDEIYRMQYVDDTAEFERADCLKDPGAPPADVFSWKGMAMGCMLT